MNLAEQRREMVELQLRRRCIRDDRVLAAMLEIPREEFVPAAQHDVSYADNPIPIGYDQTISQPYMTAFMAACLSLEGWETVLDVGTGSGYGAALLGALARRVVSIELVPELAGQARANLERTGRLTNVEVICGDGSEGHAESMPYDAISVGAAAPEIPWRLLEQLRDPGRLVIPVGGLADQDLKVVTRREGRTKTRIATTCRFVPLRGAYGWRL